jgi:hypothetical protein
MSDPPQSERVALLEAIARQMDVALQIENQLIQIRSILYEINSGNIDAATHGLAEAYKAGNVHTALRAT